MECNITLAQVNTWSNNTRSRRGDTNPKSAQKLLKQQIKSLFSNNNNSNHCRRLDITLFDFF
jgi:hypothetical protein